MDTEKQMAVTIPANLKPKIDSGEYVLRGTQVRDKLGRIVCNLCALERPKNNYFSPQIFISFEQYSFVATSVVSVQLRRAVEEKSRELSSIESKIDTVLERQTNSLLAKSVAFNEHFLSLSGKSNLTDEKQTYTSGIQAASDLATHLSNYFKEFLDATDVWHEANRTSMTFGEHQQLPKTGFTPKIILTKFKRFKNFNVNILAYAFLDVLNKLNLLSLAYDQKIYTRYQENIRALESMLRSTLSKLVNGLGDEGDIYSMMYKLDDNRYCSVDVLRIQKYEPGFGLDDLISRTYGKEHNSDRDHDRLNSIYDVIDLLEDVDNLRQRAASLESIQLPGSPEIAALQDALSRGEQP